MDKPIIADRSPVIAELEAGTYWWCSCGRSDKQPYCDGSHAGTGFRPVKVEIEERCRIALCTCKQSENGPRCDGAHARLD